MVNDIRAALGLAVNLWTGKKAALDDFYEAFVWAQIVKLARARHWPVQFINAGPTGADFDFRRGPGRICTPNVYSYAEIRLRSKILELHIGIKVKGDSNVAHEFDILALDKTSADECRAKGWDPMHYRVRFHAECKFHKSDMNLGIARSILGLLTDCPTVRPMLVSRKDGPPTIRRLLKPYGPVYLSNVFPGETGMPVLDNCIKAALRL